MLTDAGVSGERARDLLADEEASALFAQLRTAEFTRLDSAGETYLDYTGAALPAESQVRRHAELTATTLLGNPHSESPASRRATALIEETRADVLRFFDADPSEWTVIFTPNASGAIRLVGEAFPFGVGSRLVMSADNHNSVNGLREFASARGADVWYLPLDDELRLLDPSARLSRLGGAPPSLLAFPAQSNFSGVQHPWSIARAARALGYRVLLDAAAFVPTNPLRADDTGADFIALSFYKMFGYPTGLGALLARSEALEALRRPWFAGGTVDFVSVQHHTHRLRSGAEGFEDGTVNFLAIPAVRDGLALLRAAGMRRLRDHVRRLTARCLAALAQLHHSSGRPLIAIHGPRTTESRGGTIALNIIDRGGATVPYELVEATARARGISIRGGCFCNPGAAERAFGFDPAETARCLGRLRHQFTIHALRACLGGGRPVGAVRLSFGLPTNDADVDQMLEVLAGWRDRAIASAIGATAA